jgi:hypothetical protein
VFQPSGFYVWALAPYLALGWHFFRTSSVEPAEVRARQWAAFALFVASSAIYGDALLVHTRSTSGLAVVFFPVYLLVGGFAVTSLLTSVFRKRLGAHHG